MEHKVQEVKTLTNYVTVGERVEKIENQVLKDLAEFEQKIELGRGVRINKG